MDIQRTRTASETGTGGQFDTMQRHSITAAADETQSEDHVTSFGDAVRTADAPPPPPKTRSSQKKEDEFGAAEIVPEACSHVEAVFLSNSSSSKADSAPRARLNY